MAKQLGIHQIKGKVGERSYYRTKGVELGISRSINQGLSGRVKNAAEYANTRLNNAEFKSANAIATAAFKSVASRNRGMTVTFAIAEMTKRSLEFVKMDNKAWGLRLPAIPYDMLAADMLENYAKGGAYDGQYGIPVVVALDNTGAGSITFDLSGTLVNSLLEQGIDALTFIPSKALAGYLEVDGEQRLYAGSAVGTPQQVTLTPDTSSTVSITFSVGTPASVGMSQMGYTAAQSDANHGFWAVVSIMPVRRVGTQGYALQELSTYAAFALGQIPE